MSNSEFIQNRKPRVLVIMTGSIACFKACMVLSKLVQSKIDVEVAMTTSAMNFVGAATIEGLIGKPPRVDVFRSGEVMGHIHLMRWADLVLVMPATANFINKMAHGFGDDLASTLFLAHDFKRPLLIAPAMNTSMYLHPITQESLQKLKAMNCEMLETESGVLACGEVGWGRLLEPDLILKTVVNHLDKEKNAQDLIGANSPMAESKQAHLKENLSSMLEILITSGGTEEPIDSVRSLSNFSTGKTGNELARLFLESGALVTHIKSKRSQSLNYENSNFYRVFEYTDYSSLNELLKTQLMSRKFDGVVHLAAVSDYSVGSIVLDGKEILLNPEVKIPSEATVELKLKRNPKIIENLKTWSMNKDIKIVGFKLTSLAKSADIEKSKNVSQAVARVFESGADVVVQNDISEINDGKRHFQVYESKDKSTKAQGTTELFLELFKSLLEGKK